MDKAAVFSSDRIHRYTLSRIWDPDKRPVLFICLNPSTADETKDDPTVRRCIGYARDWGYGGMVMCNIFAFRATDPKKMKAAEDPIGRHNDWWLLREAEQAGIAVAAWGTHGEHLARGTAVRRLLKNYMLHSLKMTKGGEPGHPLYLPKDLEPQIMQEAE